MKEFISSMSQTFNFDFAVTTLKFIIVATALNAITRYFKTFFIRLAAYILLFVALFAYGWHVLFITTLTQLK